MKASLAVPGVLCPRRPCLRISQKSPQRRNLLGVAALVWISPQYRVLCSLPRGGPALAAAHLALLHSGLGATSRASPFAYDQEALASSKTASLAFFQKAGRRRG